MKKLCSYLFLVLLFLFIVPTSVNADSVLPKGYIPPEEAFHIESGGGTQPYDYRHFDGAVLQLYYIKTRSRIAMNDAIIGIDKETPSYQTRTQNISSHPEINFELGKKKDGFDVSGNYFLRHNFSTDSGIYEEGEYVQYEANISVKVSNIWMNKERFNRMTADLSCTIVDKEIANDTLMESLNHTFSAENVEMKYKLEEGELVAYLVMTDKDQPAYTVTVNFKILGLHVADGSEISESTSDADDDAGEVGFKVPGSIALGVAAGASALAGAGILLDDESGDDEKKKRRFMMYVQKDFGSSVRRKSEKPAVVRARMVEIDEDDKEIQRDDLTEKITSYGNGFDVVDTKLNGKYLEAYIKVTDGYQEDKATLTFEFNGEGGTFKNNIVFRVVDGPSIKFMEETSEGSGEYNLYTAVTYVDAIEGDGFTYKRKFTLVDTVYNPKPDEFKIEKVEGIDVSIEQTGDSNIYTLVIKNNTLAPTEEEKDIFKEPRKLEFKFDVLIKDEKERTEGFVGINLYPEGITIKSEQKGEYKGVKYVRVKACKKENIGDLDKEYQPSLFQVILAIKGNNESFVKPTDIQFKYDKLTNSNGLGCDVSKEDSLAKKFHYKVTPGYMNDEYRVQFEPADTLEEPDDGTFFVLFLPIYCTSHSKTYKANVPIRLKGKVLDPMEGWEEEYKKFIQRIEEYSLPESKSNWLERANKYASDPKASPEELRLASKKIIRQYMNYWLVEGQGQIKDAELYDMIISDLEWLKFFGDCAFSFLVSAYAGPVAEAIISPAKDYFVECLGEIIACYNYGQKVDIETFNISKTVASMGDNIVGNNISIKNWKKAAATLGCYFVYSSIKHCLLRYQKDGVFDLYGSLVKGFGDLTVQGIKVAASALFEKWIKNNVKFQEKILSTVNKYISKYLGKGKVIDPKEISKFMGKNLGKGRTINLKDQKITNVQYQLNKKLQLEGKLGQIAGFKGASKNVAVTKADFLEKVLMDLFGEGVSTYTEGITDSVVEGSSFKYKPDGDVEYTFVYQDEEENTYTVTVFIIKCFARTTGKLYELIYDEIFGGVPTASAIAKAPKEPQLPTGTK